MVVLLLSLVLAGHHGVPALGHVSHQGHGATMGQEGCTADGCGGEGDGLLVAACVAVLAMAAAVAMRARRAGDGPARPAWRGTERESPRWFSLPPAHGPPRPLRPCVLQR